MLLDLVNCEKEGAGRLRRPIGTGFPLLFINSLSWGTYSTSGKIYERGRGVERRGLSWDPCVPWGCHLGGWPWKHFEDFEVLCVGILISVKEVASCSPVLASRTGQTVGRQGGIDHVSESPSSLGSLDGPNIVFSWLFLLHISWFDIQSLR